LQEEHFEKSLNK